MKTTIIIILSLLFSQVWTPERDCWVVHTICGEFEYQRAFNHWMTGPGRRIIVRIPGSNFVGRVESLDTSLLKADYKPLDWDEDQDIDLYDYHLYLKYRSAE